SCGQPDPIRPLRRVSPAHSRMDGASWWERSGPMRRTRRGGGSFGQEFSSSGEDSFVAVVVTKLTGALLFILLLAMVIMALLPKAIDAPGSPSTVGADAVDEAAPLTIATPEALPEAIVGRPYAVALAATGGKGSLHWAVDGELPGGLTFDPMT